MRNSIDSIKYNHIFVWLAKGNHHFERKGVPMQQIYPLVTVKNGVASDDIREPIGLTAVNVIERLLIGEQIEPLKNPRPD